MMIRQQLTNLQLELIKLYSTELESNELVELKQVLARFFAQKAIKEADQIWEDRNLTNHDLDSWLNEP